jgi:hypothetical protein
VSEVLMPQLADKLDWVFNFDAIVCDLFVEFVCHCFKVAVLQKVIIKITE